MSFDWTYIGAISILIIIFILMALGSLGYFSSSKTPTLKEIIDGTKPPTPNQSNIN
jgi:hypothetical protein